MGEMAVVGENLTGSITDDFGDYMRPEITSPMIAKLPKVHRKKIIRIRQQLTRGTYDIDERLDVVLERILTDITF
jgi:hypothetical protein